MSTNGTSEAQYILHEQHDSGNCYKIRLTASLLGQLNKLRLIQYNVLKQETRTPEYLQNINSNGRVPVLQIDPSTFLPESNAACYYLATDPNPRPGTRSLVPSDRLEQARMLQWMFFEQYTHEPSVAVLRFWKTFVGLDNISDVQRVQLPGKEKQARDALSVMEKHLAEGRQWFVGDGVTLADVALFAYTHCAHSAGLDLKEWPSVAAWVERVRNLDGFVSMEE